ncbi:helix-turn-helix domain-containing protein [Saccharibacillus sacchari]|uniref:Helix-turn-helix domain-containing protein n=1 Tax=Saccharibacillus sacchari TaxID=456493 RepID=A0ACC6PHD3_9BACL
MTPEHILDPDERVNCQALGGVLALIGDKWTIMIVGELSDGPVRFNELKRRIGGITQRMLTLALRRLEQEGLVSRTVLPTVPPGVDYELTEYGKTLIEPLTALGDWAGKHHARRRNEEWHAARSEE